MSIKTENLKELYKLKEQVQEEANRWRDQLTHYGLLNYYEKLGYIQCLNDLIKDEKYNPTNDAAENIRGQWLNHKGNYFKCSICGAGTASDNPSVLPDENYCFNCGAKMDLER